MLKWTVITLLVSFVLACGGGEDPYGNWQLSLLEGQPVLSERTLTLELHDDHFRGDDGCNNFSGDYVYGTLEAGTGGDFFLRILLVTEVECPTDELSEQADSYLAALKWGTKYRVVAGQLEVLDLEDQVLLVFVRGSPPG